MTVQKKSFFIHSNKQFEYYMKRSCAIFLLLILCYSCEKHVEEDADLAVDTCDTTISYMTNIRPIIDANCISCHSGSQPPNLTTFDGLNANADRVRTQVVTRQMPQDGSLTEDEITFISCWVDNGALNN